MQPPLSQSAPGDPRGQPTQPLGQPPLHPPDRSYSEPPQPPAQAPLRPPEDTRVQPSQAAQHKGVPIHTNWIAFSQLRGHPLVDISAGKTIGKVDDVLFDEQRRVIQAFATRGHFLRGPTLVPALQATIGLDAVTFQPGALAGQDTSWLDKLPRASGLLGNRILSATGQFLGTVEDLRIDPTNGMLAAFELSPNQAGISHRLGSGHRILPLSSIINYGPDAIIASEGAISDL